MNFAFNFIFSIKIKNNNMEIRIGGKYRIDKKLGKGAFGHVYSGQNINGSSDVAIKLESLDCKNPMLAYESRLYEMF